MFKLKFKNYIYKDYRVVILCVWEYLKEEYMKIFRWGREYGFWGIEVSVVVVGWVSSGVEVIWRGN